MRASWRQLVPVLFVVVLVSACRAGASLDISTAITDSTLLLEQGDAAAALDLLDQVADSEVTAQVRYLQGNAQAALGNTDKALESYEAALELDDSHVDARANLGVVLYETGQFEEAESQMRQVLELEPNDADLHYNLGGVLIAMGQLEQAKAELQLAISLDETLAEPYLGLGTLYELAGEGDNAVDAYKSFIALSQDTYWIAQANAAISQLESAE